MVRLGAGGLELIFARTPSLVRLATVALVGQQDAEKAQLAFRDELLALMRDSAEVTWRELRRAVDDLDARTRPENATEGGSVRPYRVKP